MFALLSLKDERSNSCNLKCDPDRALELRADFMGILPGYHMSKNIGTPYRLMKMYPIH